MSNVWFITGCSSGFGSEIAIAALAQGDTVIATARKTSALTHLASLGATTLALDVTSSDSSIEAVVATAIEKHGHIDILFNNSGVVVQGALEETSDAEAKANFNVNVFGTLAVTRAVLPYMRARKSGLVAGMGSLGGWAGSAGLGIYCATKFALVGIFEALRDEVKHFGIKAVLIEPGYFRTELLASGNKVTVAKVIEDYEPVMGEVRKTYLEANGKQLGDPKKGAKVIVEALTGRGQAGGLKLPLRLGLGSDYVEFIDGTLKRWRGEFEEWKDVSVTTDFDE